MQSPTIEHARKRALQSYREWYRAVSGWAPLLLPNTFISLAYLYLSTRCIRHHDGDQSRQSQCLKSQTWIDSKAIWESADIQAPEIVSLYALSVPPSMVRLKIRQDFERNRHIENLDVINMLLQKNQQEFQETMNQWKQEVSPSSSFLDLKCELMGDSPTSCSGSSLMRKLNLLRLSSTNSTRVEMTRPKSTLFKGRLRVNRPNPPGRSSLIWTLGIVRFTTE